MMSCACILGKISDADLVITGEGRSDWQTPSGVLSRAKRQGIPVTLVSGSVSHCPELDSMEFAFIRAVTPEGMPLEKALDSGTAVKNIYETLTELFRQVIRNCHR